MIKTLVFILAALAILVTASVLADGESGELKWSDVLGKKVELPRKIELKQSATSLFANVAVNARDPLPKLRVPSISFLDQIHQRN